MQYHKIQNSFKLTIILLIFKTFVGMSLFSQNVNPANFCNEISDKEAIKLYTKSLNRKKYNKKERAELLHKCIELEPNFTEAFWLLANEHIVHSKLENKPFKPAVPYLYSVLKTCPQFHSNIYYYIGFHYYEEFKNDSATKYLQQFIDFKDENPKKFSKTYDAEIYQAGEMLKSINKENELKKKIVAFTPSIVKGVSTEKDEYLAYVSPDDKYFFYTRKVTPTSKHSFYSMDRDVEQFTYSLKQLDNTYSSGEAMPLPFNQNDNNQGGCAISIDNKVMYLAISKTEANNETNCDIYVTNKVYDDWMPIRKLSNNVNHPKYWDSQPSLSSDANTLYFASNRPGGYGGIDIYYTTKDEKGNWSIPINMGPKINTPDDEKTPFIHPDNETFYFSSSGHYGFGGFDIYYSRKNNETNEWQKAENIGSPINTDQDDIGLIISSDGKTAYLFSNQNLDKQNNLSKNSFDLYSFNLYDEAKPHATTFVKGSVTDTEGNEIKGAKIEIINTVTKKKTQAILDTIDGTFMSALNAKQTQPLLVTLKKKGYGFSSKLIDPTRSNIDTSLATIQLQSNNAIKGSAFVLNNLYFNSNSSEIKQESMAVLNAFIEYLIENDKLIIEIAGHTDNLGIETDNLKLSADRAKEVATYLYTKGIPKSRISHTGYGSKKPIAENASEIGRSKNRRTEILIK